MKSLTAALLLGASLLVTTACAGASGRVYVRTGPPPLRAEAVVVSPGPGYVWVPGYGDSTLTRIDVRTRHVVGKPLQMTLNPKAVAGFGSDVWVTSTSDGSVTHVRP